MMGLQRLCVRVLLGLSVTLTTQASMMPINTLTITNTVMAAAMSNPFGNFMNYQVQGLCFWWVCNFPSCGIDTTLYVNEFLPDAVVSVYTYQGQNPWLYANTLVDPVTKAVGDTTFASIDGVKPSNNNFSVGGASNMMEKLKQVDIIGDPALTTFFSKIHFALIPSVAAPFVVYYSSLADQYLWRTPELDDLTHPLDLLPGVRTEGDLTDHWGEIFPRIGYINQMGDFKAAAVIALRAADIATNGAQAHIYTPLSSGSCGQDCTVWPSHENDDQDVKYQEIYPEPKTVAVKTFGRNDLLEAGTYGQKQYTEGHGNYVWVMWRHYRGCIQDDGTFLGATA